MQRRNWVRCGQRATRGNNVFRFATVTFDVNMPIGVRILHHNNQTWPALTEGVGAHSSSDLKKKKNLNLVSKMKGKSDHH